MTIVIISLNDGRHPVPLIDDLYVAELFRCMLLSNVDTREESREIYPCKKQADFPHVIGSVSICFFFFTGSPPTVCKCKSISEAKETKLERLDLMRSQS